MSDSNDKLAHEIQHIPDNKHEDITPSFDSASPPYLRRMRSDYHEYFAEGLATMVLIIFGTGVVAQKVLSNGANGSYEIILLGWGIAVALAVYVGGGISGAHINPAVTIVLATYRGFSWRKVPGYILAQFIGAFLGAVIVQARYAREISIFEGGDNLRTFGQANSTAGLFVTSASPAISDATAFFSEFSNTALLIILLFAATDPHNMPAPAGLLPLILLFIIFGIGASLGWQTGFCLNPARDFGPRVALACFGYGSEIWNYRHQYWLWCPIIATTLGGLVGGFIYDLVCYRGDDTWVDKIWGARPAARNPHRV